MSEYWRSSSMERRCKFASAHLPCQKQKMILLHQSFTTCACFMIYISRYIRHVSHHNNISLEPTRLSTPVKKGATKFFYCVFAQTLLKEKSGVENIFRVRDTGILQIRLSICDTQISAKFVEGSLKKQALLSQHFISTYTLQNCLPVCLKPSRGVRLCATHSRKRC
jgi:hypothetical protein